MPIFAQYNFDDTTTTAIDSAVGNGAQNGIYMNGATAEGGRAMLDGHDDLVKIYHDPSFQMARGTLEINFEQAVGTVLTEPATILSRDSQGVTEGGFRIQSFPDGSIQITHESLTGSVNYTTGPGFQNPGDTINLSYSWDAGGAGGHLQIDNITTGAAHGEAVPDHLTMDMGALDQHWMVGAGQSETPAGTLRDIDQHYAGSVDQLTFSDSIDNVPPPPDCGPDGIVEGTAADDFIDVGYTGDPNGDMIDNNDALLPGQVGDDDVVFAYDGNDTVLAGLGNDKVYGGDGDDVLYGGEGDDYLAGDAGADSLFGGAGDDTLYGGAGDDTIYGGNGDDSIFGGIGNDSIYGGGGRDVIHGGDGDDFIDTRTGFQHPDIDYPGLYPADPDPENNRDTIYGGDGNDTIFSGDDADLIFGGGGHDLIDAGVDNDTIFGGSGNDTIIGGEGRDYIDGGDGDDLIFGGLDLSVSDIINIPNDAGDLRPENNADYITGGAGNDTIYGMDDDDTIFGGSGDDLIYGGVDNDVLFGGTGDDTIYGEHGDDYLDGGAGDDVLIGGDGSDTLVGGDGRDYLDSGTDGVPDDVADIAYGGAGQDTFTGVGVGDQVFGGGDGGDTDWDVLDLSKSGPYRIVDVVTDSDGNGFDGTVEFLDDDGNVKGSATFTNIESIVCFTPGTMIATPKGEVAVENLRLGDRVITRDNGIQEIRWLGAKQMGWHEFAANPHLKPVLVKAGSLGNGLPERDMMLSPNHRLLVANDRTALYFDEHEVLVAAKHLIGGKGVQQVDSVGTTYLHFMFDQHEVVLSNGAWTESFQPGDYTLKGLGNAQRSEVYELFPELRTEAGVDAYQAARKTLKKHEASLLVR